LLGPEPVSLTDCGGDQLAELWNVKIRGMDQLLPGEQVQRRHQLPILAFRERQFSDRLTELVKRRNHLAVRAVGYLHREVRRQGARLLIEPYRLPVCSDHYFSLAIVSERGASHLGPREVVEPAAGKRADPPGYKLNEQHKKYRRNAEHDGYQQDGQRIAQNVAERTLPHFFIYEP